MKYEMVMRFHPEQEVRFNVPLNKKNKPLIIRLRYNLRGRCWMMDIRNAEDNSIYISSIPLVLADDDNSNNLLRQFAHMNIGTIEVHKTINNPSTDIPDFNNFLKDFILLWGDGK